MHDRILELLRHGYEVGMVPTELDVVKITLRKGGREAVGCVHLVSRVPVEDVIVDILDILQYELVIMSRIEECSMDYIDKAMAQLK